MDEDSLPKLLVVTEWAPGSPGGGPAVLRQMLRDFPKEKLFWWGCLPERHSELAPPLQASHSLPIPKRLYPDRRFVSTKCYLLEHLWTHRAARHFQKTLKEVSPEAIWHVPHKWAIPSAGRALLSSQRKFHVTMQDYMDMRANVPLLGEARAKRFAEAARQIYKSALTRDATSRPMMEDLEARTGAPAAQMLHAGLEQEDFEFIRQPSQSEEEITIAYAGTIQVESSFLLFLEALNAARSQFHKPCKLIFFGNHSYENKPWFDPSWMSHGGNLTTPQLHKALRRCTWGLALMSLEDDYEYNRFSFPTKFISYLAAGLPIFTLAHPQSSVYRMAAQ